MAVSYTHLDVYKRQQDNGYQQLEWVIVMKCSFGNRYRVLKISDHLVIKFFSETTTSGEMEKTFVFI